MIAPSLELVRTDNKQSEARSCHHSNPLVPGTLEAQRTSARALPALTPVIDIIVCIAVAGSRTDNPRNHAPTRLLTTRLDAPRRAQAPTPPKPNRRNAAQVPREVARPEEQSAPLARRTRINRWARFDRRAQREREETRCAGSSAAAHEEI
jgi:hypothetical protein